MAWRDLSGGINEKEEDKSLRTSSDASRGAEGGVSGGWGAPSQDMPAVTRDPLTSDPGRHG